MSSKSILIAIVSIIFCILLYLSITVNKDYEVKVHAECPSCLCISIPTCGDVVVLNKGFPLTAKEELGAKRLVYEPYRSQYADHWNAMNTLLNAALVGVAYLLTIKFLVRKI